MSADHTDFAAVSGYLFGLKPRGRKFGIDRMRLFAAELGHPERGLPVVHVAGTNGKGSVAAMVESILRAAGWRVGLYTSPHLVHLGERVQVNRVPLTDDEIVHFVNELDPAADRVGAKSGADDRPSFFEFMTAMAFLQFKRSRCDLAVMEVGLGGEFDATNIVDPDVSVITSIGLDHCEYLGNTIEQIASAKAGIIKPGRPVVIGRVPAAAETVIRAIAASRDARVASVRDAFGEAIEGYPQTSLNGEYQRWNAATAALAVRTLDPRWSIDEHAIARGLENVAWAGRWQKTTIGGRTVVLDASHNPEGADVLAANLRELVREAGRRPIVIVGALGRERAKPLLEAIAPHAAEIHLVVPNEPRATGHAELAELVPADFGGRVVRSRVDELFPARDRCDVGAPADPVVVTGSIYLLGEVLQRIDSGAADVPPPR